MIDLTNLGKKLRRFEVEYWVGDHPSGNGVRWMKAKILDVDRVRHKELSVSYDPLKYPSETLATVDQAILKDLRNHATYEIRVLVAKETKPVPECEDGCVNGLVVLPGRKVPCERPACEEYRKFIAGIHDEVLISVKHLELGEKFWSVKGRAK